MKSFQARLSLIKLLTLFYATCLAQSNYKKALIVKENGDTLRGYVNYLEWYRNPSDFSFRSSIEDKTTEKYTVDNSTYVEIEGYEVYRRFPVQVSMNEVAFDHLTESASQPEIADTVFLKLLLKGQNVDLYSYRDQLKQRFYVLENGEARPFELGYKLAKVDGSVVTYPGFRQQLIRVAGKWNDSAPNIKSAIERSNYHEADLVKLVRLINGQIESRSSVATSGRKSKRLFLAAGINHSIIKYTGINLITSDGVDGNDNRVYKNRQSSSFLPLITFGTDLYIKPEVQKLFVRLEITAAGVASEVKSRYKNNMYSVEELSNTYRLSAAILSFRTQLAVNLVNKEKLKIYIGAGPSVNYILTFKNEMYQKTNQQDPLYTDKQREDYLSVKNFFASVMVRTGITVNKKFDISLSRYNPVELTNNISTGVSGKYTSTQLSVAYLLRK